MRNLSGWGGTSQQHEDKKGDCYLGEGVLSGVGAEGIGGGAVVGGGVKVYFGGGLHGGEGRLVVAEEETIDEADCDLPGEGCHYEYDCPTIHYFKYYHHW